jgi:hypothetical protein
LVLFNVFGLILIANPIDGESFIVGRTHEVAMQPK